MSPRKIVLEATVPVTVVVELHPEDTDADNVTDVNCFDGQLRFTNAAYDQQTLQPVSGKVRGRALTAAQNSKFAWPSWQWH